MLIITRNIGESLCIYPQGSLRDPSKLTKIRIYGVQKNQVKLGIEAPKEVAIYRDELYLRMLLEGGEGNE